MTDEDKMYGLLAVPCLMAAGLTALATYVAATLRDLPILMAGGPSPLNGAPEVITLTDASIAAGLVAWQGWRVRRRLRGEAPSCLHCDCLLGEARQRRWSVCRCCLGCARFVEEK